MKVRMDPLRRRPKKENETSEGRKSEEVRKRGKKKK